MDIGDEFYDQSCYENEVLINVRNFKAYIHFQHTVVYVAQNLKFSFFLPRNVFIADLRHSSLASNNKTKGTLVHDREL